MRNANFLLLSTCALQARWVHHMSLHVVHSACSSLEIRLCAFDVNSSFRSVASTTSVVKLVSELYSDLARILIVRSRKRIRKPGQKMFVGHVEDRQTNE